MNYNFNYKIVLFIKFYNSINLYYSIVKFSRLAQFTPLVAGEIVSSSPDRLFMNFSAVGLGKL